MSRSVGSVALGLDFGGKTANATSAETSASAPLRLARRPGRLSGPGKYRVLEARRRRAQIRARHLLDLMEQAS